MRKILQETMVEAEGREESSLSCASGYDYGGASNTRERHATDLISTVTVIRRSVAGITERRLLSYDELPQMGMERAEFRSEAGPAFS